MDIAGAKKALRKVLIQACKDMSEEEKFKQSAAICSRAISLLLDNNSSSPRTATASPSSSPFILPPLMGLQHMCLFLPMSYEVKTKDLFEFAWSRNITVSVPLMCPPMEVPKEGGIVSVDKNKMVFVEVQSQDDLESSFEPVGKLGILELKKKLREPIFEHLKATTPAPTVTDTPPEISRRWWSSTSILKSSAYSRSISGDSAEMSPAGESSWVLIVVPSSGFDSKLNRCGKGGGFYDRFVSEALVDSSATEGDLAARCENEKLSRLRLVRMGIGYECQLLGGHCDGSERGNSTSGGNRAGGKGSETNSSSLSSREESSIPMEPHDLGVDIVVTPSSTLFQ